MSYLISHFFEGGTQEQYDAIVAVAHPADGSLPLGQIQHFAGPTAGGFLVVAVWERKEQNDAFQQELGKILGSIADGPAPPQERTSQLTTELSGERLGRKTPATA